MSNLPEGYKDGITRVSNIVEFAFPFEGTEDEKHYLNWLNSKGVDPIDYLEEAQNLGTYIHNSLEEYILNNSYTKTKNKDLLNKTINEINYGIKWLNNLSYLDIQTEVYVRDSNQLYQGAVDLLYKDSDGRWILADWKTYGIAKKKWGLNSSNGKIPAIAKKKRQKVQLQMSLYARVLRQQGINVDRIELLYLCENGLKVSKLTILPDKQLENIISSYYKSLVKTEVDLYFKTGNMIITIQSPTGLQYEYVKIDIDTSKLDTGDTVQEEIDKAIQVRNYIIQKVKQGK